MMPAAHPVVAASPTPSPIPIENPYTNLTNITIADYYAIRENKTCLVPTQLQCLQDLYKKVYFADPNPIWNSTIHSSNSSKSTTHKASAGESVGEFFIVIAIIAAIALVAFGLASCVHNCGNKRRIEERKRRVRVEAGLESGNASGEDADSPEIQNVTPPPRRSCLWKSFKTRKSTPGSLSSGSARRSRSTSRGVSNTDVERDDAPAVPSRNIRREPSVFDGAEGLPLPPPIYEMARLDPLHEEDLSEAPAPSYSWEDVWRNPQRVGVQNVGRERFPRWRFA